jgi:predicted cupin superfamily sugar epimerase
MTAADVIALLDLKLHPEGGHYRETFRDPVTVDGRSVGTAIYFLLSAGERSHWHRVDAAEIWHFHAGSLLSLQTSDGVTIDTVTLGPDLSLGHRPQGVVPAGVWQSASTLGDWTLVGCTVSPGFDFAGFELAPAGWSPEEETRHGL